MVILRRIQVQISGQSFSICHWNLSGISAHNFTKILLLTAYVLVHNFDAICLSETYLNSETSTDDKNLEIPGYYLLRANHPYSGRIEQNTEIGEKV